MLRVHLQLLHEQQLESDVVVSALIKHSTRHAILRWIDLETEWRDWYASDS